MTRSFTLSELAALTNSTLQGDGSYRVYGVADLLSATPRDISFLSHSEYLPVGFESALAKTNAGAIFLASPLDSVCNMLIHSDPSRAFQMVVEAFLPEDERRSAFAGIHETAIIHPSAKLGDNVSIGPYAVIDKDVVIGDGTTIASGCYLGPGTILGKGCHLYPHTTVREFCSLGDRVILQPGAVIGSCGFGYTTNRQGRHEKISQLGIVEIGDDVEIGANTTVDRARFGATKIGSGTKIDNGCQIAHNVHIGENCLLAGHVAIAGSTKIGDYVVIGGQTGITGHIEITSHVMIAAQSGIAKSIVKPGKYAGRHAQPLAQYLRNEVAVSDIKKAVKKMIAEGA
jgi:UDP-3-O-[3-hydroxymyristoyl] glucosamine N-acyltransferase